MRKPLVVFAAVLLLSAPAFATYYVVMKDGSRYLAKSKWTVVNGKALVHLENGSTISLDPSGIDAAKSEEMTRMGGASVLAVEQAPTASKFSSANPIGSISLWHPEHGGFARCVSICSRIVRGFDSLFSSRGGTFGGGGGGGVPYKFSRIHFPRRTGEVLSACDVTVRMLPWPSSPRRALSVSATRRYWLPYTFGIR